MGSNDYRKETPLGSEKKEAYARRLEAEGQEEMFIRKALRAHYAMEISELSDFMTPYQDARLRHVRQLMKLRDYPSPQALYKKVSGSLDVSLDEAERLVRLVHSNDGAGE